MPACNGWVMPIGLLAKKKIDSIELLILILSYTYMI